MNKVLFGDCREQIKQFKELGLVAQTVVTSPPYYGLRDYGTATWEGGNPDCEHTVSMPQKWNDPKRGENHLRPEVSHRGGDSSKCHLCGATRIDSQIGLEKTPEEYIDNLVSVFRDIKDILADDGTIWVNIGDSYAGNMSRASNKGRAGFANEREGVFKRMFEGIKQKDLIGIPWMLAFALRADGWYLRSDIIWNKPNCLPSSVTDRVTTAHEYIFMLSKSKKYYFDYESIMEPVVENSDVAYRNKLRKEKQYNLKDDYKNNFPASFDEEKRRKRSVWSVNVRPYTGSHSAVFPPDLIVPCIQAGSKIGDVVFDPFFGSGTTAEVALKLGRQYAGCELNLNYKQLQDERIKKAELEIMNTPTELF